MHFAPPLDLRGGVESSVGVRLEDARDLGGRGPRGLLAGAVPGQGHDGSGSGGGGNEMRILHSRRRQSPGSFYLPLSHVACIGLTLRNICSALFVKCQKFSSQRENVARKICLFNF